MWFTSAYTFLGGLGIFFFGMKTLSDGLQSIAGNWIRKVINALTTNRFSAVLVGTFVTTLVQSSSVTTVMVVGLVNAGLMELTQAIGVIFGANIGTTITGWIIAIKVGKYGLLFVGMGMFPMLFSSRDGLKQLGRILVALGFVFMGLKFMSGAFKPLKDTQAFLSVLQYFTAQNLGSLLACVSVGALLTFIVQSSSAMLGVTIALAATGAITFHTAVGLVLGENIGTTITALLASIGGNSQAKRAARAHALFNVLGVLWLAPFFWVFTDFVDQIIGGAADALGDDGSRPYIAAHIAAAHSIFNVVNTIVFVGLIKYVARFVTWITPASRTKEVPHLKHLPAGVDIGAGMALTAAEKELLNLADLTGKTIDMTFEYLFGKPKSYSKLKKKITKYEEITDSIQAEITLFLCKAQEQPMSTEESQLSYALIRAADEFESVADYCLTIIKQKDRLKNESGRWSKEANKDLEKLYSRTSHYFKSIQEGLRNGEGLDLPKLKNLHLEIKSVAKEVRVRHEQRLQKGECSPVAGMIYNDVVGSIKKMSSHSVNVAEAIARVD